MKSIKQMERDAKQAVDRKIDEAERDAKQMMNEVPNNTIEPEKPEPKEEKTENKVEEFEAGTKGMVYKCELLNMREAAKEDAQVITVLKKGTAVKIMSSVGDFYHVETEDGTKGFCMKHFIRREH